MTGIKVPPLMDLKKTLERSGKPWASIKWSISGFESVGPLLCSPPRLIRMKRAIVRAFSSHSLTLTVDATKFLVQDLERRIPALKGDSGDSKVSTEEAQEFLNQLLVSADKSKRT